MKYIMSIDQSTQGTKLIMYETSLKKVYAASLPHRQLIFENGWVEHDLTEIWENVKRLVSTMLAESGIAAGDIACIGISNQRETAAAWDRQSGQPVYNAIVWQCGRGAAICERISASAEFVRKRTGLRLSPYFSAAKLAWILENVPGAAEKADSGSLCMGTIDSWLIYKMTGGAEFRTDYSNASRTQLFNINTLSWDAEVCKLFGIPAACLPEVCDSDSLFGYTDFEGILPAPVPIHAALGDSHASLLGHGCMRAGQLKASYGTGSSVMMNIGTEPVLSENGLVTSLAWRLGGRTMYVLEGNINYSAAIVSWLKDDMRLITSPAETQELAMAANKEDTTYIVPAFTGLGAPWWRPDARAAIIGMSRLTGRAEIVRAALDAIVYQITDIVKLMQTETGVKNVELRADGGASSNAYLMQTQSDILHASVKVSEDKELSCRGAAYAACTGSMLFDDTIIIPGSESYTPEMPDDIREAKYEGWKHAVKSVLES